MRLAGRMAVCARNIRRFDEKYIAASTIEKKKGENRKKGATVYCVSKNDFSAFLLNQPS
jgi:hypothetical protein